MAHTVTVGTFEGPFDLLLALIAQRRMDIGEIALADITDDYLAALHAMDTVDLEATTEFLVIAATLLELKAARLLPVDVEADVDDVTGDARDLLYARLLDYQVYAEAAAFLGGRLEDQQGFVPRDVALEARFVGCAPPIEVPASADDLAELFRAVLSRADERDRPVDISHLPPITITVEAASSAVVGGLRGHGGTATFRTLTAGCRSRIEVAVTFLAVLELYRTERVDVAQASTCGELVVTLDGNDHPVDRDDRPVAGLAVGVDDVAVAHAGVEPGRVTVPAAR